MQGIKLSLLRSIELHTSTLLKQVLSRTFEPASFKQAACKLLKYLSSSEKEHVHRWNITVCLARKQTRNSFKDSMIRIVSQYMSQEYMFCVIFAVL